MENMVGLRFLPTDEEIVDHYLRLKNNGGSNTSHVDQVISTLNICNFDPWDLPPQSRIESSNQVWYFFGRKESKYKKGERQKRKTKSGFWKKTGVTYSIKRKRGNREKIGEKRVLVFYKSGSKSNWVMHEYHHTSCLSPNESGAYTICKVQFKGEASKISSSSGVDNVEHSHSLATPMNNPGESENSSQFSGFLDHHQEMQFEAETQMNFEELLSYDLESLLAS
ncbi:NAC domain-containing protein 5 [Raphanus sativus]|uniref:NAC domain-containing protein 5-like n=1 Tax=Raphanus sativus TaxID=3726 RepID=A0A9W3D1P2_RAPSA|nr:NAC domain-containing protein 5-like [Raphanus sativus]XP_056866857.1 NAC domain-containing protein 5-like [Raphanus sativus]KAJ4866251.1 NAC domain-containing protein 5 [Raphanus sativus]KAJ4895155.1 NAC domain-containing protein 5 [Raphanus sativus]